MSVPFRERNPVIVGAVSLAVIAVMILAAFRAQDLPLIGGGDTYTAAFAEAGGLKVNDEVRIAGVRVGKVDSVELDGNHVKVSFRVESDLTLKVTFTWSPSSPTVSTLPTRTPAIRTSSLALSPPDSEKAA